MLSDDADRYIALRRVLGYKLRKAARHLQSFARYAADRGETHVRAATAIAWAATAPTPGTRYRRLAGGDPVRALLSSRGHGARSADRQPVRRPRDAASSRTSTRRTRSLASSMPPARFGDRSRTRYDISSM